MVHALILRRTGLGLLLGKFHQCLTELSAGDTIMTGYYSLTFLFIIVTHCRLNELPPYYILEDSHFDIRYVRLCDLDIPREKVLNYQQTVETLIRCCVLRHLIWVCTVCHLPF